MNTSTLEPLRSPFHRRVVKQIEGRRDSEVPSIYFFIVQREVPKSV
jgi:hypothetical protein